MTSLRAYVDQKFAEFDAKLERVAAELRTDMARLEAKLDRRVTGRIKWTFVIWIGTLAPLVGLIVLLTRQCKR